MSYANQFHGTTYAIIHRYFPGATAPNIIHIKRDDPRARCGYLSKPCDNMRAVKRNGELHRYCEHHRDRANADKRKLERHRKVKEMVEQFPIDEYLQHVSAQYEVLAQEDQTKSEQLPPSELLVRLDLDEDDLNVLAAVLCVDGGSPPSDTSISS